MSATAAKPYKRTPVFDENTLPAGLRREHRTEPGVWGIIRALEGRLRYQVLDPASETILEPGHPGLMQPDEPHRVEPLGPMRMQVEFYNQLPEFRTDGSGWHSALTQTLPLARPKLLRSFRFLLRSGGSRPAPTVTPLLLTFVSHHQQVARIPTGVNVSEPIYTQDWATAIRAFSYAALRDTCNADIQNYLGFAYRRSGQLKAAFKHYEQALALNPRHRGAHESVGEAFLGVGDLAKAEEHLGGGASRRA